MAHYGRIWPMCPVQKGFLQFYYGGIWSAAVYQLWFTRERSKVRSLVRPPSKALVYWAFLIRGTSHFRSLMQNKPDSRPSTRARSVANCSPIVRSTSIEDIRLRVPSAIAVMTQKNRTTCVRYRTEKPKRIVQPERVSSPKVIFANRPVDQFQATGLFVCLNCTRR
jgi:hypothetical protein